MNLNEYLIYYSICSYIFLILIIVAFIIFDNDSTKITSSTIFLLATAPISIIFIFFKAIYIMFKK